MVCHTAKAHLAGQGALSQAGKQPILKFPQLNRAIKYIPYVLSRAAGAPRRSSLKGGAGREDRANNTSAASSHKARAAGHDTHTGMMILALATRHRVERPATRMGGGTLNPMERPCPSPFEMPLTYDCEPENPHRSTVRILSYQRRHRFCKGSTKMSPSLPWTVSSTLSIWWSRDAQSQQSVPRKTTLIFMSRSRRFW